MARHVRYVPWHCPGLLAEYTAHRETSPGHAGEYTGVSCDLLALDTRANLVVVELKRDQDRAHMELQALRYAAMVSTMTFARAVDGLDRMFCR